MNFLKQYAQSMIPITDEEWEAIANLYQCKEFSKGELIFRPGEVCQHSYYLSEGKARSYGIDNYGKDFTWTVHINDTQDEKHNVFLGDYVSLITKEESDIFCEALDDCRVYIAPYESIEALYESGFKWMKLAKQVAESQFVFLAKYQRMLKRLNAKDRYLALNAFAPLYEKILPDYQYASLLDITPQSLSRLKKELKQCD